MERLGRKSKARQENILICLWGDFSILVLGVSLLMQGEPFLFELMHATRRNILV